MYKGKKQVKLMYQKERLVDNYDKERFSHFQGKLNHTLELFFINQAIKKNKIKELLEIAPGTGRITKELKILKYLGLDSSPQMLKKLEKIKKSNFEFVKGDAFDLPFKKKRFECILCFRLLRHFKIKKRIKLYNEMKRVIKRDGIIIFDALSRERGFLGKIHDFFYKIGFSIVKSKEKIYDKYYTKKELVDELHSNGFKILNIDSVNPDYALFSPITRLKLNFIGRKIFDSVFKKNIRKRHSKKAFSWVVVVKKA
ncbi:methyltransferase domain-containing protein [Candidatus Woesearchaeota archaeon]|nr:methyltransferase domain-containing protein [Candidatus Woesearchaeota archaeon]